MPDKSCPRGLKALKVERGHESGPPIPCIPVEDDVAEAAIKASGALEYKLELPRDQGLSRPMGKRKQ